MPCERCGGMMVRDRFLDEIGRAGQLIWRCITCGDIIDPIILINRIGWQQMRKKVYQRKTVFRAAPDS